MFFKNLLVKCLFTYTLVAFSSLIYYLLVQLITSFSQGISYFLQFIFYWIPTRAICMQHNNMTCYFIRNKCGYHSMSCAGGLCTHCPYISAATVQDLCWDSKQQSESEIRGGEMWNIDGLSLCPSQAHSLFIPPWR